MKVSTREKRKRRHLGLRSRIKGTANQPRLSVFRSNRHLWAQLIDDELGRTLVAASDQDVSKKKGKKRLEIARILGELVAKRALEKKILKVVFDRGGYKYHGLVKELADGARKGGLVF